MLPPIFKKLPMKTTDVVVDEITIGAKLQAYLGEKKEQLEDHNESHVSNSSSLRSNCPLEEEKKSTERNL